MAKKKSQSLSVYHLTLGALWVAVFGIASNVPGLSAIHLIPGVPITLQVFLAAMMGYTLGVRGGVTSFLTVILLTVAGLPMMSGGMGGPGVFVRPTGGYIIGFIFIVLITGLYSDHVMSRLMHKKLRGLSLHLPAAFAAGMIGVILDYACGSAVLIMAGTSSWTAFPAVLVSNFAYLPVDMIKIGMASVLSLIMFARPAIAGAIMAARVRYSH